jgi:DNA-binding transcriptional MocR family regulator
VRVEGLGVHRFDTRDATPGLLLGYGALSEQAIRRGVAELARAIRDVA